VGEEWRAQAACRGLPTELWFPQKGDNHAQSVAKEICGTCPVQQDCYDYAMEVAQQVELLGTWGGTSQKQRIAILLGSGKVASRSQWMSEAS
jgi:WhiB family redox-sensing transcriptional regulator